MAQRSGSRAVGTAKRTQKIKAPADTAKANKALLPAKRSSSKAKPAKSVAASRTTKTTITRKTSSTKKSLPKSLAKKSTVKAAVKTPRRAKAAPPVPRSGGKTKSKTPVIAAARPRAATKTRKASVLTKRVRRTRVSARTLPVRGPSKPTSPTIKTATAAAAGPRPTSRKTTDKIASTSRTGSRTAPRPRGKSSAPYLAAELGQPIDHRGEPLGAGSPKVRSDKDLQEYTLQLWRQMQSGQVVNRYTRAIERAGLTVDEIWTAGITETRQTSSTEQEVRRYRQKLLFRANLLEAILTETVAVLRRLDHIEPAPSEALSEPV